MTAYPAWTPASRPGIIPLHPLTFGTILGRSFAALRQNPRVLLGFALCVQAVAYILVILAIGGVAIASFSRLDTMRPGSDDYQAVLAGSVAITVVVGAVLGLAAGALSVIVQGVVVSEVAHAVLAEKLTLGALWRKVKPVAWRLIGYSFLVLLAITAVVALAGVSLFGIAALAPGAAVVVGVLLGLAALPVVWWLMVKLALVPSAIIIERATIGDALGRSWRLTRGRFWPILGIIVLLNLIFWGISQVVSIPFSFASVAMSTIITPTGDPQVGEIIALIAGGLLSQAVILLIQAVATVVQATATALIYIDCRMRHEGLDLDLLTYVERRDAGAQGLPDPYLEHIGRVIAPRFPAPAYAPGYPPPYQGYPAPQSYQGYAAAPPYQGYAPPPYPAGPYGQATDAAHPPQPGAYGTYALAYSAPQPAYPASPPPPQTQQSAAGTTAPADPAHGTGAAVEPQDGTDRESPWA
ncbi:hypothetical protein G5T42_01325 [Microbacterium sp. 4R-513]|uniref:glycerophosphoryl diester phosphodiesterase membrane domain-containing protein n=1 Tax=Microbacterium sp. 4R-513 TaxID=2567934 RepID=UPI0013E1BF73|nr:glycerophosphoryl diester phosphodiesterase membrane domain-containing protein [Microbacterium sp. 4R-513]QIG38285.1 hypothetical protein G5T42_01325 [Microbacterium sp. 4R-513]